MRPNNRSCEVSPSVITCYKSTPLRDKLSAEDCSLNKCCNNYHFPTSYYSLEDELRFLTDLRISVIPFNDHWMSSQSDSSLIQKYRAFEVRKSCLHLRAIRYREGSRNLGLFLVLSNWTIMIGIVIEVNGDITNSDWKSPCFAWHPYGKLTLLVFKTELVKVPCAVELDVVAMAIMYRINHGTRGFTWNKFHVKSERVIHFRDICYLCHVRDNVYGCEAWLRDIIQGNRGLWLAIISLTCIKNV